MATRKAKAPAKALTINNVRNMVRAAVNATDRHGQAATMWQTIQAEVGTRKTCLDDAEVKMVADEAEAQLKERLSNPGSIKTLKSRVVKLNEFAPVVLNVLTGELRQSVKATVSEAEKFGTVMRKCERDVPKAIAMYTTAKLPDYVASAAMHLNALLNFPSGKKGVQTAAFKADIVALADKYNMKLKNADDWRSEK